MKQSIPLVALAVVLAACSRPSPHDGAMNHGKPIPSSEMKQLTISSEESADENELAFSIRENESIFTEFGVNHTKEMHVLVVRDDLQHFHHLHPTRDASGIWRTEFVAPAGGTYWIYGDFIATDDVPYTLRMTKVIEKDEGETGIAWDFSTEKNFNGYAVSFQSEREGTEATLMYDVRDAEGNTPTFESYLAADAHSVLVTADGRFIHTHGTLMEDGKIKIDAKLENSDSVRLFTQFQIQGEVITTVFDLPSAE